MLEKINHWKIEKVYVAMMSFFGLLMVFLTPPIQVPDEPNHLYRIYQIAEGNLRAPAREFNNEYGKKIYFFSEFPSSLKELQKIGTGDNDVILCKNYFSLNYAPQALFVFFAKLFSDSLGAVFYGARIGAMLFTTFCIFLSIRLLPEKKFLIFVIAFMPMFLFEITSLSADAVIYSVAFLFQSHLCFLLQFLILKIPLYENIFACLVGFIGATFTVYEIFTSFY